MKSFFWGTFLAGIGLLMLSRPDYFNTIAHSDYANYGAVGMAAFASAAVIAGVLTGFHKIGANIHDCIDPNGAPDSVSYIQFD